MLNHPFSFFRTAFLQGQEDTGWGRGLGARGHPSALLRGGSPAPRGDKAHHKGLGAGLLWGLLGQPIHPGARRLLVVREHDHIGRRGSPLRLHVAMGQGRGLLAKHPACGGQRSNGCWGSDADTVKWKRAGFSLPFPTATCPGCLFLPHSPRGPRACQFTAEPCKESGPSPVTTSASLG